MKLIDLIKELQKLELQYGPDIEVGRGDSGDGHGTPVNQVRYIKYTERADGIIIE